MPRLWHGPCGDPTCYRGAEGSGGPGGAMVFKDGPCHSPHCQWPWQTFHNGEWITVRAAQPVNPADPGPHVRRLPPRPHYTDNPTPPIVDAGSVAREEKLRERATFATGEWVSEL